jgi:hypothetical protein
MSSDAEYTATPLDIVATTEFSNLALSGRSADADLRQAAKLGIIEIDGRGCRARARLRSNPLNLSG